MSRIENVEVLHFSSPSAGCWSRPLNKMFHRVRSSQRKGHPVSYELVDTCFFTYIHLGWGSEAIEYRPWEDDCISDPVKKNFVGFMGDLLWDMEIQTLGCWSLFCET